MNISEINQTLNLLTHGIYIVGVKTEEKINLMTAAWISQVSNKPPMITVAIGKKHYTAELLDKCKYFTINILNSNQIDIAKKCGFSSGRDIDKTKDINISLSKNNMQPLIDDCSGWLECELVNRIDCVDHILFIAKCVDGKSIKKDRLIYNMNKII